MKESFNQLIADIIKPFLKQHGFKKKGLTFYHYQDELIFVINFQKSHGNSYDDTKFYINCGIHSLEIDSILNNPNNPTPKEWECHYKQRISSILLQQNDGYYISQNTDINALGDRLTHELTQVFNFFASFKDNKQFVNFLLIKRTMDYTEFIKYLLLKNRLTDAKGFLKKLHQAFGKEPRWHLFEDHLASNLSKFQNFPTVKDLLNQ